MNYMYRMLSFTYGKWTFQGDLVLLDAVDAFLGDDSLAILQLRRNINRFPFDRDLKVS
jgi:hypothetical protein